MHHLRYFVQHLIRRIDLSKLEAIQLTPAIRTDLMILVAKKLRQAAGEADLSVKANAYAAAVTIVGAVAGRLESCALQEEGPPEYTIERTSFSSNGCITFGPDVRVITLEIPPGS